MKKLITLFAIILGFNLNIKSQSISTSVLKSSFNDNTYAINFDKQTSNRGITIGILLNDLSISGLNASHNINIGDTIQTKYGNGRISLSYNVIYETKTISTIVNDNTTNNETIATMLHFISFDYTHQFNKHIYIKPSYGFGFFIENGNDVVKTNIFRLNIGYCF